MEVAAIGGLKTLHHAQQIWRRDDIDGNGKADYWTLDIAGLYAIEATPGKPVCQISETLAQADPIGVPRYPRQFPEGCRPKAGYYYRLIPIASKPCGPPKHKSDSFAICAYPAEYGKEGNPHGLASKSLITPQPKDSWIPRDFHGAGIHTFVVTDTGALWKTDLGPTGKGIDEFPADPSQATPPWHLAD